jgi:hypothetical protein
MSHQRRDTEHPLLGQVHDVAARRRQEHAAGGASGELPEAMRQFVN